MPPDKTLANLQVDYSEACTIILAGGEGNRLFPLTQSRCKPAVTFGGRYRIIDVAISNSINSAIPEIFVISQFLAPTLNGYIANHYLSKPSLKGRIQVLSPNDQAGKKGMYQGTADAIRKNLHLVKASTAQYFVILSGDQLYSMHLGNMLAFAKEKDADLTIATLPVSKEHVKRMGVMQIDTSHQVTNFFEKPKTLETLDLFKMPDSLVSEHAISTLPAYLGSMGIYIFKKTTLVDLLEEDPRVDFGKHLIPTQMKKGKTFAYVFNGYWEDIGTIRSFYDANLRLAKNGLCLDLYNEKFPIYTASHDLPSARLINTRVTDSIICDGSIIEAKEISHSMIGIRSHIGQNTVIRESIIMGNQSYAPPLDNSFFHGSKFRIGKNCRIEKTIIDEHCYIGDHVTLVNKNNMKNYDGELYYIRDGIIIIPSGTYIPDNFTIS